MPIHLARARRGREKLLDQCGGDAVILDVTSKGADPWVRFSPFYPHGDIPIPFSPGRTAASVEGIWQGLKVFEGADACEKALANSTMRNIKLAAEILTWPHAAAILARQNRRTPLSNSNHLSA